MEGFLTSSSMTPPTFMSIIVTGGVMSIMAMNMSVPHLNHITKRNHLIPYHVDDDEDGDYQGLEPSFHHLLDNMSMDMDLDETFRGKHSWNRSIETTTKLMDIVNNNGLQRFPTYLRITATSICIILLMIGCPGNILVPFVVLKTKDLRNSTNIFLINLSIADLLILLISCTTLLIELHSQPETWFLGLFMCKAVSFVEILVAHGSILTMLAISLERYYAICRPLVARYKCTKKRAFHIIIVIWIIATLSSLPMMAITKLTMTQYIDGSTVPVCSNKLQEGWHTIYFIVIIFTFFFVPFIILVILFVLISKKLRAEGRSLSTSSDHRTKVRRQVAIMLASVCIAFFVCLLPFRLMTLWIILSTPQDIQNLGVDWFYILLFASRILLYVNSSINPIIYNVISSNFRAAFGNVILRKAVSTSQYPPSMSMSMSRSSDGRSIVSERTSSNVNATSRPVILETNL